MSADDLTDVYLDYLGLEPWIVKALEGLAIETVGDLTDFAAQHIVSLERGEEVLAAVRKALRRHGLRLNRSERRLVSVSAHSEIAVTVTRTAESMDWLCQWIVKVNRIEVRYYAERSHALEHARLLRQALRWKR